MIQTPGEQVGSRLTWAELRELHEREEQDRRERTIRRSYHCESEGERAGRKLFGRHL